MKKIIIMALLMMWAAIGNQASAAITGDVNDDGTVSSVDITILYNYLLNNDVSDIVNGDVDGDGSITAGDITYIYNIMLNGDDDPGIDDNNVNVVYDGDNATVTDRKSVV